MGLVTIKGVKFLKPDFVIKKPKCILVISYKKNHASELINCSYFSRCFHRLTEFGFLLSFLHINLKS